MLRRILIGIVALVALFLAGAYVLPQNVHVQRSVEIAAPPAKIFALINSHKRMTEWSPWREIDPNAKVAFSGPEAGVGAKMSWESDNRKVGRGTSEIVDSVADKSVKNRIQLDGMEPATASFVLEPKGTSTVVTWGFDADMGANPIGRWFGLMMDSMIGPDYEKGLANLKKAAEKV